LRKYTPRDLNEELRLERLSKTLDPFVVAFGGVNQTDRKYRSFVESGADDADYRDLFADILNKEKFPHPPTLFRIGEFLRVHYPWMCGLAFINAAYPDAFVGVINLLSAGRPDVLTRRIVEHVPPATRPCGADAIAMPPSLGGQTIGAQALNLEIDEVDLWSNAATFVFNQTMTTAASVQMNRFLDRQEHRRQCVFSEEDNNRIITAFKEWLPLRSEGIISSVANGRMAAAYSLAREYRLSFIVQERVVHEQLRLWIEEDGRF
jgi:hypothetical protein